MPKTFEKRAFYRFRRNRRDFPTEAGSRYRACRLPTAIARTRRQPRRTARVHSDEHGRAIVGYEASVGLDPAAIARRLLHGASLRDSMRRADSCGADNGQDSASQNVVGKAGPEPRLVIGGCGSHDSFTWRLSARDPSFKKIVATRADANETVRLQTAWRKLS
jgi:hypothetical protein